MEIYKDIEGFEGLYSITNTGRVWSHPKQWAKTGHKGKFLKTWLIGHGYEMVMLYKNKKASKFLVHRLVAKTYIPNDFNAREVNHKNGKIKDNRVSNLEWVTSSENKEHAIKTGLRLTGEKLSFSKFTNKQVKEMKKMKVSGLYTQKAIADHFGASTALVSLIINNKVRKNG